MKKKKLIIPALPALLVILGGLGILGLINSKTTNPEPVRLYLPEGTTAEALCDTLLSPSYGVIHKTIIFTRLMDYATNGRIRPGSYVVEPRMRTLALVRKLRNGQQDPIRLTIGKFRTPGQLNDYLNRKLMHDDFNFQLSNFHLVLPNTYEFYWTVSPDAFMQRMAKEYDNFWQQSARPSGEILEILKIKQQNNSQDFQNLAKREIIILASIIEEETNNNQEKPLIASVYLNRLKKGMPLQADPTVKYAVGDFTLRRILNKHLAVESPFNTYLHTGLPPAPICLPSKASIDAVLNAPETNYLYFCASPNLDGTHRFAATLAGHNRNAAAYHAALNRNGIKR